MVCSRLYIKSFYDENKKIVKIDLNSINVTEIGKNTYKSAASEETIIVKKKNKLFSYLTKFFENGKMFVYEKVSEIEDIRIAEKQFLDEAQKHFTRRHLFSRKKEKAKLASIINALYPQE